jgi:hypothetical protein
MSWARRAWHLVHGHRHLQRVTVEGVRYFRCPCGYQVPQIARSPAELARVRSWRPVERPSPSPAPPSGLEAAARPGHGEGGGIAP